MSSQNISYKSNNAVVQAHIDYIDSTDPLPQETLNAVINIRKTVKEYAKIIVKELEEKCVDKPSEADLLTIVNSLTQAKNIACGSVIMGLTAPKTHDLKFYGDKPSGARMSVLGQELHNNFTWLVEKVGNIVQSVNHRSDLLEAAIESIHKARTQARVCASHNPQQ